MSGANGASGGMAILWRPEVLEVTNFFLECNWQWFRLYVKQLHCSFSVFNIYGPNNNVQKRFLWQSLSTRLEGLGREVAILGGDFNAILNPGDKKGGKGWISESQKDFSNFVNQNGLIDVQFKKGECTWTNRREGFVNIAKKLDRFLVAGNWAETDWSCSAEILPFQGSDHFPICLRF